MILLFRDLKAALMALVPHEWEGLKLAHFVQLGGWYGKFFTLLVDQKLPLRPIQALSGLSF